mmetsp:Transcript_17637/g.60986  ORF Transcript_17637/g.60986 Transcript_17637/m.60986 type:complete len:152 (-) Transcript_17637:658-1113(-)
MMDFEALLMADLRAPEAAPTQPIHADFGTSADGLRWTDAGSVEWPDPQRFDLQKSPGHNNLVPFGQGDVATTRIGFQNSPGRARGLAASLSADFGNDDPLRRARQHLLRDRAGPAGLAGHVPLARILVGDCDGLRRPKRKRKAKTEESTAA